MILAERPAPVRRISTICAGSSPTVGSSRRMTLRVTDQRLRNANALTISLGELADLPVCHVQKSGTPHVFFDCRRALRFWYALDLADKRQVFARGHVEVERRKLRQVADVPLCFLLLFKDVVVFNEHGRPRLQRGSPRECSSWSTCPAPFWPQKTVNFARLNGKADIVYRQMVLVCFCEVANFDFDQRTKSSFYSIQSGGNGCNRFFSDLTSTGKLFVICSPFAESCSRRAILRPWR